MSFQVEISKQEGAEVSEEDKQEDTKRIIDAIEELERLFSIPYKKPMSYSDIYRIRGGGYRITYV